MISGTEFIFQPPALISHACRGSKHKFVSDSEIQEIEAQCESERAACLACEDCMVVIELEGSRYGTLELFVWMAVAFKHGAFERQEAALQAIARDLGAETIAFLSRRKGWARRLGPEWQRRGSNEFVRSVN